MEEALIKQLRAICENCNFYSLRPDHDDHIKRFVRQLTNLIDEYERQEAMQEQHGHGTQAEYHESELDTASEDEQRQVQGESDLN